MNLDIKTRIIIHSVCIIVALSGLIYVLVTGGTVWQYVFASAFLLCCVGNVWLDWKSEKRKKG